MLTLERRPLLPSISAIRSFDPALFWLTAVLLMAAAARLLFFSGLAGSDETVYSLRGLETARGLIIPSTDVGDLRYGVNLPIAGFLHLFGFNMVGLHAWAMLCSLGEIGLVFVLANRLWGLPPAIFSAVLLAVAPMHVHAAGRALADAPLAFFITLAFFSFFIAERQGARWLYALAGAAIGFSWWIKPPVIVFGFIFLVYAILRRRWNTAWILVAVSAAVMILLEWGLFNLLFGDPWFAIHVVVDKLQTNFIRQDAPWGDHAAFFYFKNMFLDGRDMAAMPLFALFGLLALAARPAGRKLTESGYVVLWGVGLIAIFSFLPYSFSPFKLIPKQSNYALMFFAPVALLAGFGMSLVRPAVLRYLSLLLCCVVGLGLATLPQYEVRLRHAALEMVVDYALSHPGITVFAPQHVLKLMRVKALLAGSQPLLPVNVRPLKEYLDPAGPTTPVPAVAFLHPRWPELVKTVPRETVSAASDCTRRIGSVSITVPGFGQLVVDALLQLREKLPERLGRQLNFVVQMHDWPNLEIDGCGVSSSDFPASWRVDAASPRR